MGNNFTHNPRNIYLVVVLIWAILFVTVMSGIVAVDLQRAERKRNLQITLICTFIRPTTVCISMSRY